MTFILIWFTLYFLHMKININHLCEMTYDPAALKALNSYVRKGKRLDVKNSISEP